jgi:hypothetical protein
MEFTATFQAVNERYAKQIEAKNQEEANQKAAEYANRKNVKVTEVIKTPTKTADGKK